MSTKKEIRARFRWAVFDAARFRCQGPGCVKPMLVADQLDAHHITDRRDMPHGGYVAENGIALCSTCHEKAETFHATGTALPGWHPDDLYRVIGSSAEAARRACARLAR